MIGLLLTLGNLAFTQVTPPDSVPGSGKGAIKSEIPSSDTTLIITSGLPDDVVTVPTDSADTSKKRFRLHLSPKKDFYDPKVAVRRSLVLPGWGQVYNNRIWKVPIIYAGFATFTVFIIGNHQGYLEYDRALKCTDSINFCYPNPYATLQDQIGTQGIYNIREQYRRSRDFNIILCGLWYVLNLVDAYVDAHLRGFNVSEDLSLDVNPSIGIDPFRQKNMFVGASLTLNLRR